MGRSLGSLRCPGSLPMAALLCFEVMQKSTVFTRQSCLLSGASGEGRLGSSWRNSEKSDGKSRQVAANWKKELTGFKSPLSTHWDLGRKEKKRSGYDLCQRNDPVVLENRSTCL